ncbi:hypothetical protein GCM10027093_07250 [Paraburkholderia jirisanensis]
MQINPPSTDGQPVRGMHRRRALRTLLHTARRSRGVLLAAATVALLAGCASMPGPSGSDARDANASSCTGPVSFCNIFFGS